MRLHGRVIALTVKGARRELAHGAGEGGLLGWRRLGKLWKPRFGDSS